MSHDRGRKLFFARDRLGPDRGRDRDREWERQDYRRGGGMPPRKRSRSLTRGDLDKRRSRTPRKSDKDMIDDNILSEISKLPEPSELWDGNQFQDAGGYSGPPMPSAGFPQEPPSNPNYPPNYQPTYSGIYDDFPPLASAHQQAVAPDMASWNQMGLPPPPVAYHNPEDQLKKEAAIETEMRHQKAALSKQREDYIKKATILKKELDTLKDQRNELRGDAKRSPSPDTKRFLKENTKLQLEIQNKLKTINNVVDMLNGIIGEEAQEVHDSDDSPDRKRKSRSPSTGKKFNYVYYDPEMHWCRVCNEFPPTAKDYLNHLHSAAHHKMAAQHMEAPWHSVAGAHEGFPSYPAAPTKRTPIRGLQFFVPSTAWYCKLCDQFIGDLHCASAHLKSVVHSKNYTNFVEQNPHWETDWMSDRQKAFEKVRASNKTKPAEEKPQYTAHTITFSKDGFHTKRPKKSPSPSLDEKKKKKDKKKKAKRKRESSTSSSSQSDSSDESTKKKKAKAKKKEMQDAKHDKALEQWMSNIKTERLTENDRKLLDNIKSRIKKERESTRRSTSREKERIAEMQRKIRESERRGSVPRESRERHGESRESREQSRDSRALSRERRVDARRDRWRDTRDSRDSRDQPAKKPDIKKMPFIGKMPVYKHLGKAKTEETKKDEQKKKEEETLAKKRLEDAEIQKKVAEFKDKIAQAQLERRPALNIPPPTLALPNLPALPTVPAAPSVSSVPSAPAVPAVPAVPSVPSVPITPLLSIPSQSGPTPTLPKDFQEALDIIFPTDQKTTEKLSQELFNAMQQPGLLGMPPALMPPFPALGLMQPHAHAPGMFGFDLTSGLTSGMFPQPQLYDSHVPMMPQKRHNKMRRNIKKPEVKKELHDGTKAKLNGDAAAKMKEEMDDLAMLGIDASDVGAGI